jgi:hypothetical protein
MAVFADYLDLRVAVSEAVGNRNISDVMPRLVQMAESMLNQKLRHRSQITSATLTFASGVSPLPADFLEMINVFGLYGADYPSVYLHAAALEAAKFLRDAELAQAEQALLTQALNDMKIDDDRARWSNATVRIQMVTP